MSLIDAIFAQAMGGGSGGGLPVVELETELNVYRPDMGQMPQIMEGADSLALLSLELNKPFILKATIAEEALVTVTYIMQPSKMTFEGMTGYIWDCPYILAGGNVAAIRITVIPGAIAQAGVSLCWPSE